jgi:endoglucanase
MRRLAILILLSTFVGCVEAASATPPAAIRVGGPSAPDDPKVAIVGAAADLRGRVFRVLDGDGDVVLRGRLTGARGKPAPWRRAFKADLTRITAPGRYRVRVGRTTSRAWRVREGAASSAIRVILNYFAANSDGREASPEHGPSHLRDAQVASGPHAGQQFDLTGGWMDAGDTLKFTQTIAYTALALQAAARLDPADEDVLNPAADVGIRWLLKAHPAPDLFIAQVGDARDHELGFRDPASDDASDQAGIGARLAYPNMGGDLGGKVAAALAMAAGRSESVQRETLLAHARDWYDAGEASDRVAPKLDPPAGDFYTADTKEDALAAGAAALYRATGERGYLDDALAYLSESPGDGRLSWNAVAGIAAADLCGALGAPAVDDQAARDAGCAALRAQARAAARVAGRTAFGTPAPFTWGQTGENGGAGALAGLAGRAGLARDGLRVAAAARDWLLGRNPWSASFVAGYGPHSPRNIHHWASLRGRGRPRGAVVGGPAPVAQILEQGFGRPRRNAFNTPSATYEDRVRNYVTSEPAIDYAAGSILLLATLR